MASRPREIFIPLEVNFADSKTVAKLARFKGRARPCRDLLVQMWCYCRRELSDGHVPLEQVGKLAYPDPEKTAIADADRLVEAGLAERTDDGYYLPSFLERNPTRAEVQAESERKSKAGREGGIRSGQVRSSKAPAKQNGSRNEAPASESLNTETEHIDRDIETTKLTNQPTSSTSTRETETLDGRQFTTTNLDDLDD